MANLVTLSRLLLVLAVMLLAYAPPTAWRLLTVPLLILAFVTDAVDGYVARRRGEATVFGAMLDIAVDRAVEISLWVVLADLNLVPVWVPIVFVVRGALVDTIRGAASAREQRAPFDTLQGGLARWLVAGSFVRTLYAVIKAVAFCWLLLLHALFPLAPELEAEWGGTLRLIGDLLVYASVALCLLRGAPVVLEYLQASRVAREPGA
ncbi:MAG: CDP-alcohol phosphatidyltransferase family protein [Chromatiales bacterium]|jgi:CDP-diacylglycerol--glycerol-3-phosphate 3-phosphatidyltransferase